MTTKPDSARAREAPPVEARVEEIRELMQKGAWYSWLAAEFARRWGISEGRVREHAAEASRQIRSATREEAQAKVQVLLEKAEYAAAKGKTPAGDLVRVAQLWARIYGLDRPGGRGSSGAREVDEPEGTSGDDWWKDEGGVDEQGGRG
jgi:hypothetical protein